MIVYKRLKKQEIILSLFEGFIRTQQVTKCWRRENGEWMIKEAPFTDDWGEPEYKELVRCLQNTAETGGLVMGAFLDQRLAGFVSVEKALFGSRNQYMDLSSIHVSQDMRGRGIGKMLFFMAADFVRDNGAEKLYISSHSAVETQAFYRGMGCEDAEEYKLEHVEREPYDCQLEYDVDAVWNDDSTSRKLTGKILEKLPDQYKKAVFCYESSLNLQAVDMWFQTESGELYTDLDLVENGCLTECDHEDWIDQMHHICGKLCQFYRQLTGDVWHQMFVSMTSGSEPEFYFSMEDWCDVSERLKQMLLVKREFGVIRENDKPLMQAFEAFMLRHKDTVPAKDSRNFEKDSRDLLECFIPYGFTGQMLEDAKQWLTKLYEGYRLSCMESQAEQLAKMILYAFERNEEPLTEDAVRMISRMECIRWLEDLPAKQYEYYYVPYMDSDRERIPGRLR